MAEIAKTLVRILQVCSHALETSEPLHPQSPTTPDATYGSLIISLMEVMPRNGNAGSDP